MKLTPKQYRNIANGMDRIRECGLIAGKWHLYGNTAGTYFSDRFKPYQYNWGKEWIFDNLVSIKKP